MQHINAFERMARDRVEARLREAEHDARLRLAREAAAARRTNDGAGPFRRIVHALAAFANRGRRATVATAHHGERSEHASPTCCPGCFDGDTTAGTARRLAAPGVG